MPEGAKGFSFRQELSESEAWPGIQIPQAAVKLCLAFSGFAGAGSSSETPALRGSFEPGLMSGLTDERRWRKTACFDPCVELNRVIEKQEPHLTRPVSGYPLSPLTSETPNPPRSARVVGCRGRNASLGGWR